MSATVTLTLRPRVAERLEVDSVAPDRCANLSERDIAALPVWVGRRAASLGDFFDVTGERSARVRIAGALTGISGLGAGMAGGELVIDGDAGDRVAAGMTGGSVTVHGSVGNDAGVAMAGGTLHVEGSAGDRLGAAEAGAARGMTGGEIVVAGSAGAGAAARSRRGLVVVGGDTGDHAALGMIAGTLVVLGRVGAEPGLRNKRGSVVARAVTSVPVTYRYACTYEPPHVRFLMTYLHRRYGLAIDPRLRDGRYRRYCGDLGAPGKGELLAWVAG